MARRASSQPTDVELEILRALWARGTGSVGQVHDALAQHRRVSYGSTLKMMQIMRDKGLLVRDDDVWPAQYRPAATQKTTQLAALDELVHKVFGGSARALVMTALAAKRVSAEELAELKQLVDEAEKKRSGK
jgi:BlaI family transcriptional regulator, penicillinase repressor